MLNELAKKASIDSPKLTGAPEGPTAPVGTNTDQLATTKGLLQALAAFGLTSGRSANVSDLDNLRGTSFFGYSDVSVGAENTGGGYDAVGFQIEALGQRTQFGITTASRVAVRTDDSNDYSGFSPWLELATVEAVKAAAPSGQVAYFASESPPTGWLKRNGAAYSRTAYSALFAVIGTKFGAGNGTTTFNVPDDRELIDRAWTDGLNATDSGRVLFSTQAGQIESHSHTGTAISAGAHTHIITNMREFVPNVTDGNVNAVYGDQVVEGTNNTATASAGAHTHALSINAAGGNETRMANRAYLACIKY
ncbi:MAG: phage tail protein [Pseudomonas sp.]|uniref:phage tail protein n=1 Tax=Pseudomonas sp. TaxID=306 RepID=UPI0033151157